MRSLTEHLTRYAAYHRDRRNIATHLVGIPMIVLAVAVLLSRPSLDFGPLTVSPAWVVTAASCLFYLALDRRFGLAMTALLVLTVWLAQWIAGLSTMAWASSGIGLFVVGWIIQFVGHAFEGRKPAFVDDIVGLLIGPLFIAAEVAFMLGWREPLRRDIEAEVGPTRSGSLAETA